MHLPPDSSGSTASHDAPTTARVALDVLDSLLEGCQVIGFDYRYLFVNTTVVEQSRRTRDQLLGRTMMECYPGIDATPMFARLRTCMEERTHSVMENEFTYPDGTTGWFELRFIPVPEGTCILSIDVTDDKRTRAALQRSEEQLRQAQKMEAIGRLAGGVAHDFNNMLSVILSYAGLVLETLPPEQAATADDVREIERAGRRAAELTSQLLAFSRQQVTQPRVVDLNDVVANVDKMLRRVLGEDIELRAVASPNLGLVLTDPGQIEQVLLNLAVNARDAMPNGGKLTLETANVVLDDAYARDHLGSTPGPHVMLAVSDTGVGMDRETQARIFEPFFTTKPLGKGTGLGLSTVFGIVQQSRGSIWVYSEPPNGTTFKIYLPMVDSAAVESAVVSEPVTSRRGRETVLVVEDDEQLRRLTNALLERDGYHVIVAASAADALRIAEDPGREIHLLLTDVVMPQMNGAQLATRVRALRPDTKVLYMSGYTGDVVVRHGILDQGAAFVQKPLTPAALGKALREVLGPAD